MHFISWLLGLLTGTFLCLACTPAHAKCLWGFDGCYEGRSINQLGDGNGSTGIHLPPPDPPKFVPKNPVVVIPPNQKTQSPLDFAGGDAPGLNDNAQDLVLLHKLCVQSANNQACGGAINSVQFYEAIEAGGHPFN